MNEGSQNSEVESSFNDSSENKNPLIMKGIRRSVVLNRFTPTLKYQLSERISPAIGKTCLGTERFKYLEETNPQNLSLYDDGEHLIVFFKKENLSLPAANFLSEARLKHAMGWRREQDNHDDYWTFVASDVISASLVLHSWEDSYEPRCTSYLLQKVAPEKYLNSRRRRRGGIYHQCHDMDLETGLVYAKKVAIPKEMERRLCTDKWNPVEGEDMRIKITEIYRYKTLDQALKRLHTHPVGATLYAFEGKFESGIYCGPCREGAKLLDYHGVIFYDGIKINGELIALCKTSSGADVDGSIVVSLKVMI